MEGRTEVEGAVEQGHVTGHDEDDGLEKENLHGPLNGLEQAPPETAWVVVGSNGRVPQFLGHPHGTQLEQLRRVRLLQE